MAFSLFCPHTQSVSDLVSQLPSFDNMVSGVRSRGGSHKGNNGLKGKPSNNKGKKRSVKVGRASAVDIAVRQQQGQSRADDIAEDVPHVPITAYMLRQPHVEILTDNLLRTKSLTIIEQPELKQLLGHTGYHETDCILAITSDADKVSTTEGWRVNVTVSGIRYTVPEIARTADRKVRPIHLYMASSHSGISRAELALMSRAEGQGADVYNGSHVCGGRCINHGVVERNSVNQSRKMCHSAMKAALQGGKVQAYKSLRMACTHSPRCFINPLAHGIVQDLLPIVL